MSEHGADPRPPGRGTASPPDGSYTVRRADLGGMTVGVAVAGAVAAHTGANVLELDPLSDEVDVDALEELWTLDDGRCTSDTRVTFPYMGYEVTVTGEELRLQPLDE